MWNDFRNAKLHNMHIDQINLVALLYLHLVTDITTTGPRNLNLARFLLHHVTDVYDGNLPYPDAQVAGFAFVGGPYKYCINQNSPVMNYWILEHAVPHIANSTYDVTIDKLLGMSCLRPIFSDKSH